MTPMVKCRCCQLFKNPGAFDGQKHRGQPVCRACSERIQERVVQAR